MNAGSMTAIPEINSQLTADEGFVYVHSPPSELGLKYMRRFQEHGGYNADYYLLARMIEDRCAERKALRAGVKP